MARRRGGYRPPAQPAAVSGPGALSQRTDGRVPAMQRTGLPYGENKAVNEMQAGAPLSPQPQPGAGTPAAQGGARLPFSGGAFTPTARPGEPLTAGVDFGPGPGRSPNAAADHAAALLQVVYEHYPTPALQRVLARHLGA